MSADGADPLGDGYRCVQRSDWRLSRSKRHEQVLKEEVVHETTVQEPRRKEQRPGEEVGRRQAVESAGTLNAEKKELTLHLAPIPTVSTPANCGHLLVRWHSLLASERREARGSSARANMMPVSAHPGMAQRERGCRGATRCVPREPFT